LSTPATSVLMATIGAIERRLHALEEAAQAVIATWDDVRGYLDLPGPLSDYDAAAAPFEELRRLLAATVGGTDQPSPGGGDPNAGK
jgi:hypothetical protein